jgi:hypothetical protein
MNSEITKLHQQLLGLHQQLSRSLVKVKDQAAAMSILCEMEELNFRVMMAGRLLFKETTAAIDKGIGTLVEQSVALDEAIKDIEKIKDLVKAVGKFLGNVDKTLDAIKLR